MGHIQDCNPVISLHIDHAMESVEEPVKCHWNNNLGKVEIDHNAAGNKNLVCSHRYDRSNDYWMCKCRSKQIKSLESLGTAPPAVIQWATFAPTKAPNPTPAPPKVAEGRWPLPKIVPVVQSQRSPVPECKHKTRYKRNVAAGRTAYEEMVHQY